MLLLSQDFFLSLDSDSTALLWVTAVVKRPCLTTEGCRQKISLVPVLSVGVNIDISLLFSISFVLHLFYILVPKVGNAYSGFLRWMFFL